MVVQSMPDVSPTKWHLAHTTWFFETFVLSELRGHSLHDPRYGYLFNSYYNGVGEQFSRPRRGLLSRPTVAEVLGYRKRVDETLQAALDRGLPEELLERIELGINHEQQHQELLLTDIKHVLAQNPLHPSFGAERRPKAGEAEPLGFHEFDGGLLPFGHDEGAANDGDGFCFDNERPRHRAWLEPFALADRLVTVGEFREFQSDGGYERAELWLDEGWAWRCENDVQAPLYQDEVDGVPHAFTLGGRRPLGDSEPVTHVSLFEADAFARWAGGRLPSERELEHALAKQQTRGNFLELEELHPRPAPSEPSEAPRQLYGDAWEWTASSYAAYPGYRPLEGALGEYNGKFMCNQYVLRGGSCATPRGHVRPTYRNFFPASSRWQFTGIRVARDLD